jgi:hypothetical protein
MQHLCFFSFVSYFCIAFRWTPVVRGISPHVCVTGWSNHNCPPSHSKMYAAAICNQIHYCIHSHLLDPLIALNALTILVRLLLGWFGGIATKIPTTIDWIMHSQSLALALSCCMNVKTTLSFVPCFFSYLALCSSLSGRHPPHKLTT